MVKLYNDALFGGFSYTYLSQFKPYTPIKTIDFLVQPLHIILRNIV